MTQQQKQSLITATAASAKKFSDIWNSVEPSEPEFYAAWEHAWDAHGASFVLCPTCDPKDPGDPPPA